MVRRAVLLALLCWSVTASAATDTKTLMHTMARKALNGRFGELSARQKRAYRLLLTRQTPDGLALVTSYGPWDPPGIGGGPYSATGKRLTEEMCAAPRSVPFGSIIWTPWGVRIVEDRGGAVRKRGRLMHFDYYFKRRPRPSILRRAPWVLLRRGRQQWKRHCALLDVWLHRLLPV